MVDVFLPENIVIIMFGLGALIVACFWAITLLVGSERSIYRLEKKVDELVAVFAAILTEKQILVDTPLLDRYIAEANLHEEANGADTTDEVQHGGAEEG